VRNKVLLQRKGYKSKYFNILDAIAVTFDQFNAYFLNKSINFLQQQQQQKTAHPLPNF